MAYEGEIPDRSVLHMDAPSVDWGAVYAEQLPRVYNYFRYRFGDDSIAEDLTSRTFEKAWKARARYRRDVAKFATWLLAIAGNVAIDYLRANRRAHVPLEEAPEVRADGTPEEDTSRVSDIARLVALMAELPRREQDLLALKYGAEANNRTIARLTGLSESNVGTILHRAVAALREQW